VETEAVVREVGLSSQTLDRVIVGVRQLLVVLAWRARVGGCRIIGPSPLSPGQQIDDGRQHRAGSESADGYR